MRQGEPAFGHHLGEISKAELVSQIPAHAEHDDLLVKVPALEKPVHFRVRSSALSFDRFANDYAVSKQFAPEPLVQPHRLERLVNVSPLAPDGLGDRGSAYPLLAQGDNARPIESGRAAL
jgi:hypothetical protein